MERRWTWEFDVPRRRLWKYVADTDWVNRHAGLPPIEARYEPLLDGGSRRIARFRRTPFTIEWEERPTVWRVPEFFEIERRYRRGPLARFFARTTLEATQRGTRVTVDVTLEPAMAGVRAFLPLIARRGRRGADRAFRLAAVLAAADVRASGPADTTELGAFARLAEADVRRDVVAALANHVATAEDRELAAMRPYELADRWKLSRRETLRAFLHATRLGLLNLSWNVLCPGCRGATPGFDSLEGLQHGYHCDSCNLPFDPQFDRSVEVTFDARPLGRRAEPELFCIASPQRSDFVHAQAVIPPRGQSRLALDLERGSYQLTAIGAGSAAFVASDEEPALALTAALTLHGMAAGQSIRSGASAIELTSELDREVLVRIEAGRWPDTLATAAQVTALEEFRQLFSSQVLAPGFEMSIQTMAVLFTDLMGSTAIYTRTGDAPAFRIVSDHFEVMREIVSTYEGTIVKTIGDAVMAVFVDPAKCLEAALRFDAAVGRIDAGGEPLRLRAGFHVGPCIAMRANERIDYFGTTINLASRLQALAGGGEVTLARTVAESPAIAARLRSLTTATTLEPLELKGFPQRIDVVRICRQA
ncbi:MAG TPA: DUF5939 domain-containing protein [Candidatus Tumulicola sp.]